MKLRLDAETVDALWEVRYATSTDECRPALRAVWLNQGWAVASDSYRLSARPVDAWTDGPVAVPPDALVDGNGSYDTEEFPLPLPSWDTLVEPTPHSAVFIRSEILAAAKQVEVMKKPAAEPVWLFSHRGFGTQRVALISNQSHVTVRTRDSRVRGWLPTVGLQKQFLVDALRASDSERVCIAANDPRSPVAFFDYDEDDEDPESGFELVMPCCGRGDLAALTESPQKNDRSEAKVGE